MRTSKPKAPATDPTELPTEALDKVAGGYLRKSGGPGLDDGGTVSSPPPPPPPPPPTS